MKPQYQEKTEKLKSLNKDSVDKAKESVCENCVWPFRETDQDAMTKRCDNCNVMSVLDQAFKITRDTAWAAGMIEAACIATESIEKAQAERFGGIHE